MRQQRVTGTSGNTAADGPSSVSSPFRSTTFTVLWTATVVSNIGTWMYNAASGWLMRLNKDSNCCAAEYGRFLQVRG
jgi:hypothetical protein